VLLYFASRSQNVDEWIASALDRGEIVLADRFTEFLPRLPGLRPQPRRGYHPRARTHRLPRLKPSLTLLVDIDAETSLARARARNLAQAPLRNPHGRPIHRIPPKSLPGLPRPGAREPERVKLVDGRADVDTIERQVWSIIGAYV